MVICQFADVRAILKRDKGAGRMVMRLSRRAMLAGAASGIATGAVADAPLLSLRPRLRSATQGFIAQAGLSGTVGFAIADMASGEVLESFGAATPMPPASVAKTVTALYALDHLGPDHRYQTRVIADGQITDGVLYGNLILAGGGDPNLVTDDLAGLADSLSAAGLKEIRGDFHVWDRALPFVPQIDDSQLSHFGYNPTITGLNLNFNRVYFEWKRAGSQYTVALDARSRQHRPDVTIARMQIVDRSNPVFTYADVDGVDQWTVARRALGRGGARWLPVRRPALYAAEVFATFARTKGIVLPAAKVVSDAPDGTVLARHQSVPLPEMLGGMMRYSTNITAEVLGLSATRARVGHLRGLRTSALGMARWAQGRAGINPMLVDHSGLGDASRMSAADMLGLLMADGAVQSLRPLMMPFDMLDQDRQVIPDFPAEVRAKTGTLNFVATLAGYIRRGDGRDLAFALFASDLDARAQGKKSGGEVPRGATAWNRAARRLQQNIVQHWAVDG